MKRLVVVLLLMAFVLAGCSRDPIVLLDNDIVSIVRSGRVIHVVDVETGEACDYSIVRVKRNTGAVSQESRVGGLKVISGLGAMAIIAEDGQSWIVRFARFLG